ncbi:hypothetical protein OYE22_20955 [Streptomyces sp. 71268]|uniref:hypothetical protein n=1 Tax=Streptomyces sp. 71268 TaxID=3002640 RepID=UPI0023FA2785|nr:hypothetical protein [Streptomyces sp. 71268]WEV27388.1 hypothetical protein OYE22_20955 [Streptomyces sp. 71268]
MSTPETSTFVRLRVELVLDINDAEQLAVAAREQIDGDAFMPEEERAHARVAIRDDQAEALAYLIDPYALVKEVPGIELAQASWSSEPVDFDPDAQVWGLDDDEDLYDDDLPDDRDDEDGAGHDVGLGGRIDAAADDPDATYDPAGGWAAGGYRQP